MTKATVAEKLLKEAKKEIDVEYLAAYKSELKVKLRQYKNAMQIAKNISLEIQNLEARINDELG